jgi:DNA-binding NtrC family response regulator
VQVDTPVAVRIGACGEVALVAETDAQSRDLLRNLLRDAGYEVVVAADEEQLEAALHRGPLLEGSSPLAVLSVGLAKRCASALADAAAYRARAGGSEMSLILTYERGTLTTVAKPSVGPCILVGIFEKPFDLNQLRDLVRATKLAGQGMPSRAQATS